LKQNGRGTTPCSTPGEHTYNAQSLSYKGRL